MRVARTRRWLRRHSLRFEGIAEPRAQLWARHGQCVPVGVGLPYGGAVACPRSGTVHALDDCIHCEHFVNLRLDATRGSATLRCLTCDDDVLARPSPEADGFEVVSPETPIPSARVRSWQSGASMLVVAREELVVGVIYARQLQLAEGTVGEHMIASPWSIPPLATVGDAVEALRELRIPGLLVVGAELDLRGVVGAADLRRMGVPPALLPH
jgi:CBS domain-containing protein